MSTDAARIGLLASAATPFGGFGLAYLIASPILDSIDQKQYQEEQANFIEEQGKADARAARLEGGRLLGQQRASLAGAGVETSGSALDLLAQSAAQNELNALRARVPYKAETNALRIAADQQIQLGVQQSAFTALSLAMSVYGGPAGLAAFGATQGAKSIPGAGGSPSTAPSSPLVTRPPSAAPPRQAPAPGFRPIRTPRGRLVL